MFRAAICSTIFSATGTGQFRSETLSSTPPRSPARCGGVAGAMVQYPSTDGCFELQFAALFSVQPAPGSSVSARAMPGSSRVGDQGCPGFSSFRRTEEPDERDGADTRPAWLRLGPVRLPRDSPQWQ